MHVRPYRLPSQSAISSVRDKLIPSLTHWKQQWEVSESIELNVRPLQSGQEIPTDSWRRWSGNQNFSLWARSAPKALRTVHTQLFGAQHTAACSDSSSDISWAAATAASEDLLHTLITQLSDPSFAPDIDCSGLPDALFSPGSGTLQIEIEMLGLCILVEGSFLPLPQVSNRTATSRSLPRISDCVRNELVPLSVWAGSVEIELSRLLSLQVGDVLRLNTPVDQAIVLRGPDNTHLTTCALGRVDNNRAIHFPPAA